MVHRQPLRIAHLRCVIHRRRIHHHPIDSPIPTEKALRRAIIHPIRPQVIHVPRLLHFRRNPVRGCRGSLVKEDVGEGGVHHARVVAGVEESDDIVAAVESADPERDFALAVLVRFGGVFPDAVGGRAKGVLGDGEDGGVGVDGEGLGGHGADICAHYEGGFEYGPAFVSVSLALPGGWWLARDEPHGEVKDVFIVRHTSVTDFEHVHVVPTTRLSFAWECSYFVDDVHDAAVEAGESAVVCGTRTSIIGAIKGVVHIARHAPGVCHRLSPVPGGVFTPIAH